MLKENKNYLYYILEHKGKKGI